MRGVSDRSKRVVGGLASARLAGVVARRRGGPGCSPTAPSRPSRRRSASLALRLVVRSGGHPAARARGHRLDRRRPAGRRRAPDESGAARPDGRLPRPGWPRSRSPCSPGSSATTPSLFSVHMVQHILLTLVAAPLHRPRGAGDAGAPRGLAPGPPAMAPADPPLAAAARPRPPRRRLAPLRRRHVGGPLLAALRSRAREPARPRPRARPVPRRGAALLVAGGRGSIRARGGCPTRRG